MEFNLRTYLSKEKKKSRAFDLVVNTHVYICKMFQVQTSGIPNPVPLYIKKKKEKKKHKKEWPHINIYCETVFKKKKKTWLSSSMKLYETALHLLPKNKKCDYQSRDDLFLVYVHIYIYRNLLNLIIKNFMNYVDLITLIYEL